jgi:hypothetical protein
VAIQPNAISNAIGYATFFSRSHDAVIRVYDDGGNVIETHEHRGDFKEWRRLPFKLDIRRFSAHSHQVAKTISPVTVFNLMQQRLSAEFLS